MIKYTIAAFAAAFAISVHATDDRFGFNTHFHQEGSRPEQNHVFIPPAIVNKVPATTYIRDEIGWVDNELAAGQYGNPVGSGTLRASDQTWIDSCDKAGLKVVLALIQYYAPTTLYPTPTGWVDDGTGSSPAARFAAWLAKTESGKISVIEVFNEPNNSRSLFGTLAWPQNCAAATKLIADAVHATGAVGQDGVTPIKVIGLGAQGADILSMLKMGTDVDGVVVHPYNNTSVYGGHSAESVYEPPYSDYFAWVAALKSAAGNLPIWETECAQNSGLKQYWSAEWLGHRLFEAAWMGVQHTFAFEFISSDEAQSTLGYGRDTEQNMYVINNVYNLLASDPWRTNKPLVPVNRPVTINGVTGSWDGEAYPTGKAIGLYFEVPPAPGGTPVTSMAVCYIGYGAALRPTAFFPGVTVSFYHPYAGTVVEYNLLTGISHVLKANVDWVLQGPNVTILNATLAGGPVVFKAWNGIVPSP
jgi:hypothetical protein